MTGKGSGLGSRRSFLEVFFFFLSISFIESLVLQTTQGVHLTIDFTGFAKKHVSTSSPELSLAKTHLAKTEGSSQFAVGISS